MPDYGSGGDFTVIMDGPFAGGGDGTAQNMTSVTVSVDKWKGATSPYSQVINIGQINVNTKVDLQLSAEEIEKLSAQRIAFTAENSGGTVTLYAVGDKPATECMFQVTLTDVINVGEDTSGIIRGNTVSTVVRLTPCLPLAGGKMEGNIDLDSHELTNLRTPYREKDATPKDYVDKTAAEEAEEAEKKAKDHAETFVKEYASTKRSTHTLTVSGWSDAAPYTQKITVEGLNDDLNARSYPEYPAELADKISLAEETEKIRACTRNGTDMTFECWEFKPEKDIPVIVEVYA